MRGFDFWDFFLKNVLPWKPTNSRWPPNLEKIGFLHITPLLVVKSNSNQNRNYPETKTKGLEV